MVVDTCMTRRSYSVKLGFRFKVVERDLHLWSLMLSSSSPFCLWDSVFVALVGDTLVIDGLTLLNFGIRPLSISIIPRL